MSETQTSEYTVSGMTCAHCVASVTEEVQEISGVSDVQVDLSTGSLRFTSEQPVSDAEVQAAVEEAGYRLT
jgi:copper ion binding protein